LTKTCIWAGTSLKNWHLGNHTFFFRYSRKHMKIELSCRREAQNAIFHFCGISSFVHEIVLSCRRNARLRDVHELRKKLFCLCQFVENSIFPLFFDDLFCRRSLKVDLGCHFGTLVGALGPSWDLGSILGSILVPFCHYSGSILEPVWVHFGSCFDQVPKMIQSTDHEQCR